MSTNAWTKERRRGDRVKVPGLEVSIEKKRWLVFEDFEQCAAIDVNQGGVGLVTEKMHLELFQPIRLKINYFTDEFFIAGSVVHEYAKDGFEFYGVAFHDLPKELSALIQDWCRQPTMSSMEVSREATEIGRSVLTHERGSADKPQAQTQKAKRGAGEDPAVDARTAQPAQSDSDAPDKRRSEIRLPAGTLTIRVRNRGLSHFTDFYEAEVVDISFGGVGIVARNGAENFDGKVRLELIKDGIKYRADGRVAHATANGQGLHYGIQYTMVPPKYKALLADLQSE